MSLLRELSDEELDQYARLAGDQIRREDRLAWAQVGIGILAIATLAWAVLSALHGGFDRARVAAVAFAGLALYWPYRKAKARRIWRHHIRATREERARRSEASNPRGRDGSP